MPGTYEDAGDQTGDPGTALVHPEDPRRKQLGLLSPPACKGQSVEILTSSFVAPQGNNCPLWGTKTRGQMSLKLVIPETWISVGSCLTCALWAFPYLCFTHARTIEDAADGSCQRSSSQDFEARIKGS